MGPQLSQKFIFGPSIFTKYFCGVLIWPFWPSKNAALRGMMQVYIFIQLKVLQKGRTYALGQTASGRGEVLRTCKSCSLYVTRKRIYYWSSSFWAFFHFRKSNLIFRLHICALWYDAKEVLDIKHFFIAYASKVLRMPNSVKKSGVVGVNFFQSSWQE